MAHFDDIGELSSVDEADAALWKAHFPSLARWKIVVTPFDDQTTEYKLWQIAGNNPDALLKHEDDNTFLRWEEQRYSAIHIRAEYKQIWEDAETLYKTGTQEFVTPGYERTPPGMLQPW